MNKPKRTLVCGNIHGGYKSLLQIIERSNFNTKEDQLICLGDYVDEENRGFVHGGYRSKNGLGFEGRLTIMDVDTKEFWQSDDLRTLYPNEKGR